MIKLLLRSLPLNMAGENKSIAHPADSGFLAMSYFKLGDFEHAAQCRAVFDEAMKIESFQESEDYKSFRTEVDKLFGANP